MNTKKPRDAIEQMEQNVEREMTASAALEIQTILMRHHHIISIFISELIEEIYELNPCSTVLRKWQVKFLDFNASRGSL